MSTTPIKSAKVRNAVKAALGAAVAAPLLFAAAPATSAEIQMGETTVDVGGFVRMDAFYDFDRGAGPSLGASDAVGDDFDSDGNFDASAQYTRLSFSFNTPTSAGDIGGYIEADFFGDGGESYGDSSNLHLRKAYLTYGNWLIGQNDSVFANNFNGPNVDWANAEGDVGSDRTPQVRYTYDMGSGNSFAVALEKDLGPDIQGINDDLRGDTPLPALALKYSGQSGIFSYQAAGLLRQLEAIDPATIDPTTGFGDDDTALGWGINLGGAMAFDSGTTLQLAATYGEGINSYMGIHQNPFQASYIYGAYYDASGDVQTAETLGVVASVSQQFTDNITGSLVYGYGNISADDFTTGGDAEYTAQSASANLFYSPVDPLTFAVAYKYVDADFDDGVSATDDFDGSANRVVFSTTYAF